MVWSRWGSSSPFTAHLALCIFLFYKFPSCFTIYPFLLMIQAMSTLHTTSSSVESICSYMPQYKVGVQLHISVTGSSRSGTEKASEVPHCQSLSLWRGKCSGKGKTGKAQLFPTAQVFPCGRRKLQQPVLAEPFHMLWTSSTPGNCPSFLPATVCPNERVFSCRGERLWHQGGSRTLHC